MCLQSKRPWFDSWVRKIHWRRDRLPTPAFLGFPGGSAGKESTWNAGESCLIPDSGRSPGEEIGYPLQYSWASLVAQTVKNQPAMQEIWVQSLGWEDPLEESIATHSSILAWRIPMDRGAWRATVHRVTKSCIQLSDFDFHPFFLVFIEFVTTLFLFFCFGVLDLEACSIPAPQ